MNKIEFYSIFSVGMSTSCYSDYCWASRSASTDSWRSCACCGNYSGQCCKHSWTPRSPSSNPVSCKIFFNRVSEFFTNAFKSLEQTQKTIESQLERTEATQNELQNAMAQNLQVATENAKKLTERVEKLQWNWKLVFLLSPVHKNAHFSTCKTPLLHVS